MLVRWMLPALVVACVASLLPARASDLVSLKTPRGATQQFLLLKPVSPKAAVILFAGGHGALKLQAGGGMQWGDGNFLVRTRDRLLAAGLMVAVMDAPSDQQIGMAATFRMSQEHAQDIGAVVAHLKKQANIPVWLVGTSMGTFSAARGALGPVPIDGLVLTSTITRAKPNWNIAASHKDGVASMPLNRIAVPTLIVSHKNDGCDITPASDAAKLKRGLSGSPKVEVALLEGGLPAKSEPCLAKSEHGFFGIEDRAVQTIASFIKAVK